MLSTTSSPTGTTGCRAISATSGHLDTRTAALEIAHGLHDAGAVGCDLVLFFCSYHHTSAASEANQTLHEVLMPKHVLGCTAESILGDDLELDGVAGMSAMALFLPGSRLHPFKGTPSEPIPISKPNAIPDMLGLQSDTRGILMLADPFSTPITRLLPAINNLPWPDGPVPLLGGMASGASQPNHNRLILDEETLDAGVVGVSISGDIDLEFIISQGCRPVGEPLVITGAEQNVITHLSGKPAISMLEETANTISSKDRELLQSGILIGSVLDEHKIRFGRGDFIVRNFLGFTKERNGIVVGEFPRLGQTIQFHVRDAQTAHEDLHLLLDAQQLQENPFAVLVVTCNGRGQGLFGHEGHDLSILRQRLGASPVTGFFAAGELGPISGQNLLHGHTVAVTMFRERTRTS